MMHDEKKLLLGSLWLENKPLKAWSNANIQGEVKTRMTWTTPRSNWQVFRKITSTRLPLLKKRPDPKICSQSDSHIGQPGEHAI